MATIFIVAGPPGIGKSTSGSHFIPEDVQIIDPDLISERYKSQGFIDYKDIGNMRFQDISRKPLFSGEDFAIELNLGFQSHYDYMKSLRNFNSDNQITVVLFLLEKHLSLIDHMMLIHVSETENPIIYAQFDNQTRELESDVNSDHIILDMEAYYNGYAFHQDGKNRFYNPSMVVRFSPIE